MAGHRERRRRERPSPVRGWLFRLAAMTLVPAAVLLAVELGLWAAGYGYPTRFLVPVHGRDVLVPNERFGWRFFPHAIARAPVPCVVSEVAEAGTYRIFVVGGSAAMGTPDPAFGFGRILEVMLEDAFPGVDFEVINAAMTAVNSHVVVDVVRDSRVASPDLFLVYLGNNEVVGPFGPSGTLTPFGRNRLLIRLGLAVKRWRLGQLVEAAVSDLGGGDEGATQWRGMEMFLGGLVARDDPRLRWVYENLRRNLEAIADLAADGGAEVVLATVATNVRDLPPFASVHGLEPPDPRRTRFDEAVARAERLESQGDVEEAVAAYREAVELDGGHAELAYRLGKALLRSGRVDEARGLLLRARDLDALRFRADGRINDVIRELARARAGRGVHLVDAERALSLAPETKHGLPGDELFYEHVHLRFEGNYRLALAFLEGIVPLLPDSVRSRAAAGPPPGPQDCARRLALTDWDLASMASSIHDLATRPPFTGQLGHASRLAALSRWRTALRRRSRASLAESERAYREAVARAPHDVHFRQKLARLLGERGESAEAAKHWRVLVETVPENPAWMTGLGFALADAGDLDAGSRWLEAAARAAPWSEEARLNLGTVLQRRGDLVGAERRYREALELSPGSIAAELNLGRLRERAGDLDGAAGHYERAVALDPYSPLARFRLATVLERRGEMDGAVAEYVRAVELDPDLARAHNNLGYVYERQGRIAEAVREYLAALDADPGLAVAQFNLADVLFSQGRVEQAVARYRAGLELEPDHVAARYNLAGALRVLERDREAVVEFRRVLDRAPGRVDALHNLAWILATVDDPAVRDAAEAVELAERAESLGGDRVPEVLETLAVAHAANGSPELAAETARRALALAAAQGDDARAADMAARLRGFGIPVGGPGS